MLLRWHKHGFVCVINVALHCWCKHGVVAIVRETLNCNGGINIVLLRLDKHSVTTKIPVAKVT